MKREIKFRGIDEQTNQWVVSTGVLIHGNGIICLILSHYEDGWITTPIIQKTLGQYTFQHDANGNEIYCGDILSKKWLVEVYQNESGTFMVKFHNNPITNQPQILSEYLDKRKKAGCEKDDCVIIGNIHQNPELI